MLSRFKKELSQLEDAPPEKYLQKIALKKSEYNEIRKTDKKLHDIEIIYTPDLPKKYPNANFLIAHHTLEDCAEQLSDLGYENFYSPLESL